ncbi:PREDICTED: olfactory receptor 1F12-like [Nanorana parkeri]|uniref:olfactory receptor 1F12-like n=1 Tax=Nanorana parkeri TaxID=125878 RepID=UPI000854386E|nr:PREDICTED: olfactory receptor 1F12-like [Nanorana parkeri]
MTYIAMENQTSTKEFYILPFSMKSRFIPLYLALFSLIYVFGVFTNAFIIFVIFSSKHLHTPMYYFICNLSIVDIFYTTITVPKLLYMIISRNTTVSYRECFTQMYFYFLDASAEDILILTMAFDRYVAICHPLHYHLILNKKNCIFLVAGIWLVGSFNSFVITFQASNRTFCHSNIIHQFFCDGKALMNIACAGLNYMYTIIYIEILMFGFLPFFCSLMSYIKIIKVVLQINSREGRKKAFSTCSSHLIVIVMYYTTAVSVYMMPKYSVVLEQICSVIYTMVTPMINPLIYSLRNNEVKMALKKLMVQQANKA